MKCSLGISNFLEEISSLSHSVVFLYFFALITEEGFLISPCYSLELCIQMGIFPFLLCFWLLFFSQLFVRPPQTAILIFCISFCWGWSCSLSPVQCHEPPSIVHQALSIRSSPLNLLQLYGISKEFLINYFWEVTCREKYGNSNMETFYSSYFKNKLLNEIITDKLEKILGIFSKISYLLPQRIYLIWCLQNGQILTVSPIFIKLYKFQVAKTQFGFTTKYNLLKICKGSVTLLLNPQEKKI